MSNDSEEVTPTVDVLDGEPVVFVPMKFVDGKMFMWCSFCSAHQTYHPGCSTCLAGDFVEVRYWDEPTDEADDELIVVNDTMDIHAERGSKIWFSNLNYGYLSDREFAIKHLVHGQMYTVEFVDIGNSSSVVYLVEKPGLSFNTVLFSDVVEY